MKDRQREYETVYLLRPDANADDVEDARQRIEDAVEDAGGHNLSFDDWGQRDLAFEMRDEDDGRVFESAKYQYVRYMVPSESADVAEQQLKFVEAVLKYLTVKLDEDLIPDERLEKPTEIPGETLPYQDE